MKPKSKPLSPGSKNPVYLYLDVILVLSGILLLSAAYYGVRVFTLAGVSVFTALVFDEILSRLFKIHRPLDLSPIVTGLILVMLLPPSVPYYIPAIGSAFAITAAKIPFGGTGKNAFNPAALGFCLISLLFKDAVYAYPAVGSKINLFSPSVTTVKAPVQYVTSMSRPRVSAIDLLTGRYPTSIGCGFALVIIAGFVLLAIRRRSILYTSLSYIFTVILFSVFIVRIPAGIPSRIMLELCAGSVLFCGVFMVSDPVTSPKTRDGKIYYGLAAAAFTFVFSILLRIIYAAPFAIIAANALCPLFDRLSLASERRAEKREQKKEAKAAAKNAG